MTETGKEGGRGRATRIENSAKKREEKGVNVKRAIKWIISKLTTVEKFVLRKNPLMVIIVIFLQSAGFKYFVADYDYGYSTASQAYDQANVKYEEEDEQKYQPEKDHSSNGARNYDDYEDGEAY